MTNVTISNTGVGSIGLPNSLTVPGNGSVEVDGLAWQGMTGHPVVAAYLKDKRLTVEGEGSKPADAAVTYEAKHRGGGSFSIVDSEGKEIVDKLTKADADTFNAMSDDDKAAFVESKKA